MKQLTSTLFLIAFSFALTSCTTAKDSAPKAAEVKKEETVDLPAKAASCMCIKIYMPVCGENKKTYGNSCEADCAGVKYTMGACNPTK